MRFSRTDISKHARNNVYIYIYVRVCVRVSMGRKEPSSHGRWKRHTARIYSDRTWGRERGKERRRVVIRYLGGGGEGRLCQQLSDNGLALQITSFCVNVLARWLDYTPWSRAKTLSFRCIVDSNSRFPSCSSSFWMLFNFNDRAMGTGLDDNSMT